MVLLGYLGWILFLACALAYLRQRSADTRRRTTTVDYIALLLGAEDAYERNRRVFVDWLVHRSPDVDKMRLWLASHDAVENMVASWAHGVPTSVGVSEILWEVKQAAGQENDSSVPREGNSIDELQGYLSVVIDVLRDGIARSPEELVRALEKRASMVRRQVLDDPLGLDKQLPPFDSKVHLSMPLAEGVAEVLARGSRVLQAGFSFAFNEVEDLRLFEAAASASMAEHFGPLTHGSEKEVGGSKLRMYDDFAYVHFGRHAELDPRQTWFLVQVSPSGSAGGPARV